MWFFFFFSSRRRHTRFDCDWSSDVCSSDLVHDPGSILMFRDHLTFLGEAMTPERVKEGLLDVALELEKKRSEEHTSELQSQSNLVCRLLLEKKDAVCEFRKRVSWYAKQMNP